MYYLNKYSKSLIAALIVAQCVYICNYIFSVELLVLLFSCVCKLIFVILYSNVYKYVLQLLIFVCSVEVVQSSGCFGQFLIVFINALYFYLYFSVCLYDMKFLSLMHDVETNPGEIRCLFFHYYYDCTDEDCEVCNQVSIIVLPCGKHDCPSCGCDIYHRRHCGDNECAFCQDMDRRCELNGENPTVCRFVDCPCCAIREECKEEIEVFRDEPKEEVEAFSVECRSVRECLRHHYYELCDNHDGCSRCRVYYDMANLGIDRNCSNESCITCYPDHTNGSEYNFDDLGRLIDLDNESSEPCDIMPAVTTTLSSTINSHLIQGFSTSFVDEIGAPYYTSSRSEEFISEADFMRSASPLPSEQLDQIINELRQMTAVSHAQFSNAVERLRSLRDHYMDCNLIFCLDCETYNGFRTSVDAIRNHVYNCREENCLACAEFRRGYEMFGTDIGSELHDLAHIFPDDVHPEIDPSYQLVHWDEPQEEEVCNDIFTYESQTNFFRYRYSNMLNADETVEVFRQRRNTYHNSRNIVRPTLRDGDNNNHHLDTWSLIHDIETNPGEICQCDLCLSYSNELNILYIQCMNVLFQDVSVDDLLALQLKVIDFDIQNSGCRNPCYKTLITLMYTCLDLPVPEMDFVSNLVSSISSRKGLEVGVRQETINEFKAMVQQVVEASREFKRTPVPIDASLVNVPDVLGLSQVLLWCKDKNNQNFCLCTTFAVLCLIRYKYPENTSLITLLQVFSGIAIFYVNSELIKNTLMKWFMPSVVPQSDIEDCLTLVVEAISLGIFGKSLSFSSIEGFQKSFINFSKSSNEFNVYMDRVKKFIVDVVGKIAEKFGWELTAEYSKYDARIKRFQTMLAEYRSTLIQENGHINTTVSTKVKRLRDEVFNMHSDVSNIRENTQVKVALLNLLRTLDSMVETLRSCGAGMASRWTPGVLGLCGPPGTGKSQLITFLAKMAFMATASMAEILDYEMDPSILIYTKALLDKFFERYNQQWMFVFNEMWSLTEAEGMPSDSGFFVDCIGPNLLSLNMANLRDKGNNFFDSKVVGFITNVLLLHSSIVKSMVTPGAPGRRADEFCWYVTVKREYWASNGPEDAKVYPSADPMHYKRLDKAKAGTNNIDVWNLQRHKMTTGVSEGRIYSTEEVSKMFIAYLKEHQRHQREFTDFERDFTRNLIIARKAELQEEERLRSVRPEMDLDDSVSSYLDKTEQKRLDLGKRPSEDEVFEMHAPLTVNDFSGKDYLYDPRMDRYSKIRWESKMHMLKAKIIQHCESNESLKPVMIESEQRFAGLTQYIKKYIEFCEVTGRRVNIVEEFEAFQDNYDHPLYVLIENAKMHELKEFTKWGFCDDLVAWCLKLKIYCVDKYEVVTEVAAAYMDYMMDCMKCFKDDCLRWFIKHPYLGLFGLSCAAGSITMVCFNTIFSGIKYLCSAFHVDKEVAVVEEQQPLSNETDEVTVRVEMDIGDDKETKEQKFMVNRYYNMFHFSFAVYWKSDGMITEIRKKRPCKLTKLYNRYCMINHHVYQVMEDYINLPEVVRINVYLRPWSGNENTEWYDFRDLKFRLELAERDVCIFQLPSHVPECPNIIKYFLSRAVVSKFLEAERYVDFLVVRGDYGTLYPKPATLTYVGQIAYSSDSEIIDPISGKRVETKKRLYRHFRDIFRFNGTTGIGLCGLMGCVNDTNLLRFSAECPAVQNPSFGYFHVAGGTHCGFGTFLYKEDFLFLKDPPNDIRHPVERIEEDFTEASREFAKVKGVEHDNSSFFLNVSAPLEFPSYQMLLGVVPPYKQAMSSKITPSPLKNIFRSYGYPITRYPVDLYPKGDNNPLLTAKLRCGSNMTVVYAQPIQLITDIITSDIMNKSTKPKNIGVISTRDAVVGIPSYMEGADLSTSFGYVIKRLCQMYKIKVEGKRGIYGAVDNVSFDNEYALLIERLVDMNEKKLKSGRRMINIFLNCIKDEVKDENKARLFCAGDYLFFLLTKKYFGHFAVWIYNNRMRNGIGIGINPFREWNTLYLLLTTICPLGVDGDYSKYDKLLLLIFINATRILFRKYYGYLDPVANKVREMLFEEFLETIHVICIDKYAYIYKWAHGNTSGNFLTGIINSVAGIVMFFTALCHVKSSEGIYCSSLEEIQKIMLDALPKTYIIQGGDDNVWTTRVPGVDFYTISQALLEVAGMIYTDARKGKGGDVAALRPVEDLTFLGRGFVYIYGRMCCPLRLYSILESVQWFKNRRDLKVLFDNVCRMLIELCYHPDVYKQLVPVIVEAVATFTKESLLFTDWEVAFANALHGKSMSYDPSTSLLTLDEDEVFFSVMGDLVPNPIPDC
jgi:hypothetical protein